MKKKTNYLLYTLVFLLFLLSINLIFSNGIWFDESYTLALIRHDYSDIISILKDDMHPPLYFLCLKTFCDIFGYSLIVTKLFSTLGFLLTLVLGCTLIKTDFGERTAYAYELFFASIPMVYYFSTQQRCYSWSIFWVTLCFLLGHRLMCRISFLNVILFAFAFLFSAYNHIYALIAVAGIAFFVNIYFLAKRNMLIIILMDLIILCGYAPWMWVLFYQTQNAVSDFWQTSLEPLSLFVFGGTILLFFLISLKRNYRKINIMFAMYSILFVQVIGLIISVIIRPLYIARYAAPLMGIFALLLASCFYKLVNKKRGIIILCCILLFQYIGIACFEYLPSWTNFQDEFEEVYSTNDIFIYTDSSFGVFSYYYPENKHICFYNQSWFRAFENLEYEEANNFSIQKSDSIIWYIVNQKGVIPKWIKQNRKLEKRYSFRNDFNVFDVYLIS